MFKHWQLALGICLVFGSLLFAVILWGCSQTVDNSSLTTTTTSATTTITAASNGPTARPAAAVKVCFIHHSSGGNWLRNNSAETAVGGDLGTNLNANNYYVTETDYDWYAGAANLGYTTDFGFWTTWFTTANMAYVYANNSNYYYTNSISNPGGENQIVIFKSCFPNSNLHGSPTDAAASGAVNAIEGQSTGDDAGQSADYNVANAKWVYNKILEYFGTRTDKLFVVITSPPRTAGHYVGSNAANARAFNNWLVNDWLDSYTHNNVVVFDFYNVLTGTDNHHRYSSGVQHTTAAGSSNTAYYPTAAGGSDDHPNATGNQKATSEFVPLLNYYYNKWKGLI